MKFNKKLSDIVGINKIEDVKKPIEKAHGLPNECYLSDDYLEFEKEKIFQNNWTMIGVASSVPNPGDVKPFSLLGIPIIIISHLENSGFSHSDLVIHSNINPIPNENDIITKLFFLK